MIDPVFDDELGYRIDKREYALPEISFEPDEVAALVPRRAHLDAGQPGRPGRVARRCAPPASTMDDSSLVGIEPGGPHHGGGVRAAPPGGA